MVIGVPKETYVGENRAAFIPASVEKLVKKGAQISVESGIGAAIGLSDDDYKRAGAAVTDRGTILASSDIVLRLRKPPQEEISRLKKGSLHISFLDPFNEPQLIDEFVKNNISAISM